MKAKRIIWEVLPNPSKNTKKCLCALSMAVENLTLTPQESGIIREKNTVNTILSSMKRLTKQNHLKKEGDPNYKLKKKYKKHTYKNSLKNYNNKRNKK